MKLTVLNQRNEEIGEIWSEGDATIKARPEGIITLTRRFLDSNPGASAAEIVGLMAGWSNGYVTLRAVTEPVG